MGLPRAPASAAGLPALAAEEWRRLDRAETVVHERTAPGCPWPEVVAYRRARATPTAVMAVYADFERQAEYVPEMVMSRVVGRDANVFRVSYEYEVTGPNERYTVIVTVERADEGWRARWTLISARYARRLEGALTVLPYADGSLRVYASRVDPGTLGVALGTPASVVTRLRRTTEALAAHVERLAATRPATVARLIEALGAMADATARP